MYWFTHHDHAKTGIPSYYHIDESGYDESTLFNEGLPIQSPDLQAYIVALCEACSLLAEKLGLKDDAERWDSERQRILDFLINELWDGEQFRAKLPAKGGALYRCGSIAQLQPVMLGRRLPRDIVKKLAQRLLDEREYLTDYGVASEHLQSPEFFAGGFTHGPVVAPTQALVILGLLDGGEPEAARFLAARYLNALNTEGLALGIHPYRIEPVTDTPVLRMSAAQSVGFPFSAWVASVYLLLAQLVNNSAKAG
jgi:glycogen debranching enzyme